MSGAKAERELGTLPENVFGRTKVIYIFINEIASHTRATEGNDYIQSDLI